MPMQNSAAASSRNSFSSTAGSFLPGQDDGTDEGGEQQRGHDLERDQVGREDRVGLLCGGLHRLFGEPVLAEAVDKRVAEHTGDAQRYEKSDALPLVCEPYLLPDPRASASDAEKQNL